VKIDEFISTVSNSLSVTRVYGEAHTVDGVTVIPAAKVMGGGGGGGGPETGEYSGEGGGFGMFARPTGAFVIKNGEVSWRPAVDANRVIMLVGGIVIASLRRRRR
jgi:uncharacterized spore protein YtfJ